MHEKAEKVIKVAVPPKLKAALVKGKNTLKNRVVWREEQKYLFILSPPYCGSTLLNEIISTAQGVSVNNPWGTREGQTLPAVRKMMFDHDRRWDEDLDFNWSYIKKEWRKYWDLSAPVLLEKSPPNVIRARSIEKHFPPAYFIVFYRNPYAHAESLIRRNKRSPQEAARFALRALRYQKENKEQLRRSLSISYENLTEETQEAVHKIQNFIPELDDLRSDKKFSAHNYRQKQMSAQNLNPAKIARLTVAQKREITAVFRDQREILDYFGYDLIE